MILLFLLLLCTLTDARTLGRSVSSEKPFMAKGDIFSDQFVQTISETELEKELAGSKENISKTASDGTAMPPGYGPQPPGTTPGEEAVQEAETSTSASKELVKNTSDQAVSSEGEDSYGGSKTAGVVAPHTKSIENSETKENSTGASEASTTTTGITTISKEEEHSTAAPSYDSDSLSHEAFVGNRKSIPTEVPEGSGSDQEVVNSTDASNSNVASTGTELKSTAETSSSEEFEGSGITWEEKIKQPPTQVSGEVGCESSECATKAMSSAEFSTELHENVTTTVASTDVTSPPPDGAGLDATSDSSDSATVDSVFGFDGSVELAETPESQNRSADSPSAFEIIKQFAEEKEKSLEATLIPEINQTETTTGSPESEDESIFAKADGLSAEMEAANTTVNVEASFKEAAPQKEFNLQEVEKEFITEKDTTIEPTTQRETSRESSEKLPDTTNSVEETTVATKGEPSSSKADKPQNRRGVVEGCPRAHLCSKNCFIALDENGCQICQCLWQALSCDLDSDCPESIQYCDLGRCECKDGYEQDMLRSGFCKEFGTKWKNGKGNLASSPLRKESLAVEGAFEHTGAAAYGEDSKPTPSTKQPDLAVEAKESIQGGYGEDIIEPHKNHPALGVSASTSEAYPEREKQRTMGQKPLFPQPSIPAGAYFGLAKHRRVVRSVFPGAEKPRAAERLQWPGPCDSDENCSAGLYCIEGDCWELPDKPIRSQPRDTIPESFIISSEDDDNVETKARAVKLFQVDERLAPTPKPRNLMRFVTDENIKLPTDSHLERTTVSTGALGPQSFAPNQLIQMKRTVVPATDAPDLGMSTIKEVHSTTRLFRVHTTPQPPSNSQEEVGSLFESEGQPPAEPQPHEIGRVSRDGINRSIPDLEVNAIPPTFTKMIELPPEVDFKIVPRKKESEKSRQRKQEKHTLVVGSSEFPITARLLEMERAGSMKMNGPFALAERPTREDLIAHENLLRALSKQVKLRRSKIRRMSARKVAGVKNQKQNYPIELEENPMNRRQFESVEPQLKKSLGELRELKTNQSLPISNEKSVAITESAKQVPGIWYPMDKSGTKASDNVPNSNRLSPIRPQAQIVDSKNAITNRPIKIKGSVNGTFPDECIFQADCGLLSICCRKTWSDDKGLRGSAKFCLPKCSQSKLVFFSQNATSNDFLYD